MNHTGDGILEWCIVQLRRQQWQTATQLAHAIGQRPGSVSSILHKNSTHPYAKIKRRLMIKSVAKDVRVWEYATYHYEDPT